MYMYIYVLRVYYSISTDDRHILENPSPFSNGRMELSRVSHGEWDQSKFTALWMSMGS